MHPCLCAVVKTGVTIHPCSKTGVVNNLGLIILIISVIYAMLTICVDWYS